MAHHIRDVDYKKDSVLCKTEFETKNSLCAFAHIYVHLYAYAYVYVF